jgi:hypothetical protein
MPTRRFAAFTAATLAAGALSIAVLGGSAAEAVTGTVTIDKSFTYDCDVYITVPDATDPQYMGPQLVGNFPVGVRAQSSVPAALYAGHDVPATPATITLTIDDNLWNATRFMTGGGDPSQASTSLNGSSSDSTIGFTVAGVSQSVGIDNLKVMGAPIPVAKQPDTGVPVTPWTIPTSGTVRAIPVPAAAAGQGATLQMPKKFTADALLLAGAKLDPNTNVKIGTQDFPTHLDCVLPAAADGALLGAPIPIVAPTASFGSVKATPKKIRAKKTTPKLAVQVDSVAGTPTGTVTVTLKSKKVGAGTLVNGKATVKLKKFAKAGKPTLTVTYSGAPGFNAAATTVQVTVKK